MPDDADVIEPTGGEPQAGDPVPTGSTSADLHRALRRLEEEFRDLRGSLRSKQTDLWTVLCEARDLAADAGLLVVEGIRDGSLTLSPLPDGWISIALGGCNKTFSRIVDPVRKFISNRKPPVAFAVINPPPPDLPKGHWLWGLRGTLEESLALSQASSETKGEASAIARGNGHRFLTRHAFLEALTLLDGVEVPDLLHWTLTDEAGQGVELISDWLEPRDQRVDVVRQYTRIGEVGCQLLCKQCEAQVPRVDLPPPIHPPPMVATSETVVIIAMPPLPEVRPPDPLAEPIEEPSAPIAQAPEIPAPALPLTGPTLAPVEAVSSPALPRRSRMGAKQAEPFVRAFIINYQRIHHGAIPSLRQVEMDLQISDSTISRTEAWKTMGARKQARELPLGTMDNNQPSDGIRRRLPGPEKAAREDRAEDE